MRGSVSIETLLAVLAIIVAVLVMGNHSSNMTSMAMEVDPLLIAKGTAMRLLWLGYELNGHPYTVETNIYVPAETNIYITSGVLTVVVRGITVISTNTPFLSDINMYGEGWYGLTLQGRDNGVIIS